MKYIAFQNKKTGLLLAGTNFNYSPPRHRYANDDHAPLLISCDPDTVALEMIRRNITPRVFRLVDIDLRGGPPEAEIDFTILSLYGELKRQRS
jgi:hypothetical protein